MKATLATCFWLAAGVVLGAVDPESPGGGQPRAQLPDDGSSGCLSCHGRIEAMHPEAELSCVDCHGGDATAGSKFEAHVQPSVGRPPDERVPPLDEDLAWRRFANPMDLRVADRTCGTCHEQEVEFLLHSLHGTTAGHLSDGYYEVGLSDERGSRFAVFPTSRPPREGGAAERLIQVPGFRGRLPEHDLRRHYSDLARKECMQCHLWSDGRAVRGRVGFDGDYRGAGCAACHVSYAVDGLSESLDGSIPRNEPGHAREHRMTRAPGTETCASCHYGDASIGLHFRGLSQLPPGAPGGPEIPGTTDAPLNRTFYLNDPSMVPPDVHHERGMHCVDCHTLTDVMGDGRMHGQMEHQVEITCQSCHGSFSAPPTLRTENGAYLENVFWRDDEVILRSKVTGAEHVVPQAHRVVDRTAWEFEPDALAAMTPEHEGLECYACHAGWNVNFLGFHFSRNESLTQLDLLSGRRTPGRVTTQEKVFATWKSFYAGRNEKGMVAPYLTGFSTMGSVWNEDGELILDQVMPETAAGLSGMSMVHHQLHSTRPTARSCVECHRTSATWGMGSANFRLARQLAFVADRRGIEVVALDRAGLSGSVPLGKLVLPDVVDLELWCDPLQGHARYLFASEGGRGVHAIDVSDPVAPRRLGFVATIDPQSMELVGEHLLLADGIGGLRVLDVSDPAEMRAVGHVPTFDARALTVQWPFAYVADGPGGLAIVDVRAPIAPRLISGLDVNGSSPAPNDVSHVATMFQYSRPLAEDGSPSEERAPARHLCGVVDGGEGLVLIDVTEPTHPERVRGLDRRRSSAARGRGRGARGYRGLALLSQVDLAEAAGGEPTRERDYAYVLTEAGAGGVATLVVMDVTEPELPRVRGTVRAGDASEMLVATNVYNPPFLQRQLFAPSREGVFVIDASTSKEPAQSGVLQAIFQSYAVAVEEFPLDQMVHPSGRPLKDISHPTSRWMTRAEIERVLDVPGESLDTLGPFDEPPPIPGASARMHLAGIDEDGNGMLGGGSGDEYARAGGASVDGNGDGRVTLLELAAHVGLLVDERSPDARYPGEGMELDDDPVYLRTRTDEDGDLSRLLDGTNPYEFDRDGDDRLDRGETSRAFFAALDLDDDERLTSDELSRHPGRLRQIRYGDPAAMELFDEVDDNHDGRITRREFQVAERDFEALDLNRDGFVQLAVEDEGGGREGNPLLRELGYVPPRAEWPSRRPGITGLPPVISVDAVLETFDRDGDGFLTRSELRRRPDLFAELGSLERASARDVARIVDLVGRLGVEVTADEFTRRWDLDGDGEVSPEDLPDVPVLRFRGISARR